MKTIVIGANHAGTAAINTILSESKDNEVVVIDKNSNITFLGCGMALWIGNQISTGDGLFYGSKESLEKAGAKVHMETEVTKIDEVNKVVYAKNVKGEEIQESYDKLILATGSVPFIPPIKGIDLENVQRVKLYQHAEDVIKKLEDESIKNVAVIGAGYIGVELAEAFKLHNKNVSIIDVAPSSLSTYYDNNFNVLMDENLRENGINTVFNEKVMEFKGTDKVESIITDKREIPCDMAVVCIGFRPNSVLLGDKVERFRNGAYLVNRRQETSIKDIYAIGDCATIYDNALEDTNHIALATNAVRSGLIAGYNILGKDVESLGVQGSNAISIFGLNMVSTGLSVKACERFGIEYEYSDFKDIQKATFMECENPEVQIRIVYEKSSRRILGAQMAGRYDMSMGIHMFSLAIMKKVTIDELKLLDLFFLPHFNQPYNYITMCALNAK